MERGEFTAVALSIVSVVGLAVGLTMPHLVESQQNSSPSWLQYLPDFVELAKKLEPVVVNISTTQAVRRTQSSPQPFGQPQPPTNPFGHPFGGNDPLSEFWRRFF